MSPVAGHAAGVVVIGMQRKIGSRRMRPANTARTATVIVDPMLISFDDPDIRTVGGNPFRLVR